MRDVFYEECAKNQAESSDRVKYYLFKIIQIISFVLAGVWLLISYATYSGDLGALGIILFIVMPILLFSGLGIFALRLKYKFCIDYDYTFVTGSIRIAKVMKNIKRKHLYTFESSDIQQIGNYGSDNYLRYRTMPDIKEVVLTSNKTQSGGKNFYYIIVPISAERYMFILECSEEFIKNVLQFAKKGVFEDKYL